MRAGGGPSGSWLDGGDLAGGLLWVGEERVSGRLLAAGCGGGMWMGVRGWALAAADSSLTRVKLMQRPCRRGKRRGLEKSNGVSLELDSVHFRFVRIASYYRMILWRTVPAKSE